VDKAIHITRKSALYLLAIIALGAFFRFLNLPEQGLIFHDVGLIIERIKQYNWLAQQPPNTILPYSYIDIKINWLVLIYFAQIVLNNIFLCAKFLASFFGILTVYLTYLTAKKFYQSETIGLLSAFVLSISSFHVFYSRIPLPDSAAMFFTLLTFLLYFKATKERNSYSGWAGLTFAFALLTHFRICFFILYIFLFEIMIIFSKKSTIKNSLIRLLTFALSTAVTLIIYELFLRYVLHISFFYTLWHHFDSYSIYQFSLQGFFSYFQYLYLYDGPIVFLFLLLSLVFINKKESPFYFQLICLTHIILVSFLVFRFPRVLSPILPYLSIIVGVSIYNAVNIAKKTQIKKLILFFICTSSLFIGYLKCTPLNSMQTDMGKANKWLKNYEPNTTGLLTTDKFVTYHYNQKDRVKAIRKENLLDLQYYNQQGYKFLLTNPTKYLFSTTGGYPNFGPLTPLLSSIEESCKPLKTFPNFNSTTLERFFHENSYPNLSDTLTVRKNIDQYDPSIKIYDVASCINLLQKL